MKKQTKKAKSKAVKVANTKAVEASQVRKPTPAELAAVDEYMARTSKAPKKPVTPQAPAIKGTAPLGASLAQATPVAKKSSKKPAPKVQDDGPFSLSAAAKKAGLQELRFKDGSARHAIVAALFKAKGPLTRAELEKVAPDQVSQAIRVLRINGHVAA